MLTWNVLCMYMTLWTTFIQILEFDNRHGDDDDSDMTMDKQ